jgi:hypothetical protein
MFLWTVRNDLLITPLTREGTRFVAVAQMIPVIVIVCSIPLAFVSPTLTLLSWISIGIFEALWGRRDPTTAKA